MRRVGLILVIAAACATGRVNVPLGEPFDLRYGQTAVVENVMQIRFVELVSDSRCPRTVQCVWAGNAEIRLEIEADGRAEVHTLNTNATLQAPNEVTAFGHRVRLVELAPYPETPAEPERSRYMARLVVNSQSPP